MKILEELYCGGFDLCNARKHSALCEKLRELVIMNNQRMLAMLTDTQKEQFEKCLGATGELSELMEQEAFASGFCLAVRIMAEVMGTMGVPDIDE